MSEEKEKEDSDDLSIDFSIFGKKKKEEKREEKLEKEVKEEEKAQYYLDEEAPKKKVENKEAGKKEAKKQEIKEDDEVSIDFGKIKGFFRKKEEKREARKDRKEEKLDDEVEFDLGKIREGAKNLFSGKEQNRLLSTAFLLLLILIPLAVSTTIRMQPDYLPSTDQWAKGNIYSFIQNDISNTINQQYPNLPDANKNRLVQEEIAKVDKSGTYTFRTGQYAGQTINVQQQIEANSAQLKEFFKDENGVIYTPDIDPYYWQRYAVNIVEKGHIGDEIKDGKQWDNHQIAPNGREVGKQDTFYPITLAWFYKVLHIFNKDITVIRATQYYPVFISSIIIVFIFLIARRIAGNIAGFFAAMMAALHPVMLTRTLFSHVDSDIMVLFFTVLVMWLIFEAFQAKSMRSQAILAGLAGFSIGLFSLAWSGWWYIFDFILITVFASIAAGLILNYRKIRQHGLDYLKTSGEKELAAITAIFFAASGIFVTIFTSFETFIVSPFLAVIGFTNIKAPIAGSLWPNVLTTVAELNPGSVQSIIDQTGGILLFSLALSAVIFAMLKKHRKDEYYMNYYTLPLALALFIGVWLLYTSTTGLPFIVMLALLIAGAGLIALLVQKNKDELDVKDSILLAIFFLGTVYAGTKGVRFVILLIPAFSIAFGVSVGMIHRLLTRWVSKELHVEKIIAGTLFMMVFMLLFFVPQNIYGAAQVTAQQDIPIINDAWYYSLKAIQQDSKPDAIITSWWDFGHHFKLIADRPVTFDGTTQDLPQAHWVGKFFMTDNEGQAVGILRMLNCGGNKAFDEIYSINNDTIASVNILYELFEKDRNGARLTLLKYNLTSEQAESVLKYTHCNPPESYVIASEDMIGKSGVWAHFGSWNFERADIWQNVRGKSLQEGKEYLKTKLGYTDEKAESMYYEVNAISGDSEANSWIAPWPSYAGNAEGCGRTGELVQCANGLIVNLTTNESYFATAQGKLKPASFVYMTAKGTTEKSNSENVIPQHLSAMVMPVGDSHISVLSSPELANSMFTRLFYMRGHGLKHFDMLSYQRSITGWNIFVWKVDWQGNSTNIVEEFREDEEKTEVREGDTVTLNYIGTLSDGQVFDSSIQDWRNRNISNSTELTDEYSYTPFSFKIGTNAVIPGFEKNVKGMKLNEEKTFTIPPEEAYRTGELANKQLAFRVKITKIE